MCFSLIHFPAWDVGISCAIRRVVGILLPPQHPRALRVGRRSRGEHENARSRLAVRSRIIPFPPQLLARLTLTHSCDAPPGSRLTYRVVVVPIPSTCRPHPSPSALGWVVRPWPSHCTVEPLLGMPRRCAVDLVVAAPKHAAFVLPLPMLLNDPRIRVEVISNNRPANACLIEARNDGVLETRVARRKCVSHAGSMGTSSQHEGQRDGHGLHGVGSLFARFTLTRMSRTGPFANMTTEGFSSPGVVESTRYTSTSPPS